MFRKLMLEYFTFTIIVVFNTGIAIGFKIQTKEKI